MKLDNNSAEECRYVIHRGETSFLKAWNGAWNVMSLQLLLLTFLV